MTKAERNRKELHIGTLDEARQYIGRKCAKLSGKPFKSGNRVNTITGVGEITPTDGKTKVAFHFSEDDTYVACKMCYIVE